MSEMTAQLGNRLDVSLSKTSFYANEGCRQVWDSEQHARAEGLAVSSTTSGENRIDLPSDFQALLNVSNLSSSPPFVLRPANVNEIDSLTTTPGLPQRYLQYATWLELYPSPDSSYSFQMRYQKQWSDMTITTSQPSLATRYHYAGMLKGLELLAESVLDAATATRAAQRYVGYMSSTPNDFALRQRQRPLSLQIGLRPAHGQQLDFDHRDT